jgi:hypothetical protein
MTDSVNEREMDEVHRSIELARENILDAALILFQDSVPGFDFTYPIESDSKSVRLNEHLPHLKNSGFGKVRDHNLRIQTT